MASTKNKGMHSIVAPNITGTSKSTSCSPANSGIGDTNPEIPNTHKILKILLPTTLPTAISRSPLTVATTEVTTSGKEVPAATIVKPITASLTPHAVASSTALCTNQRAPNTNNVNPPITNNKFCHIGTLAFNMASTSPSET